MKRLSIEGIKKLKAEQISTGVLYALVTLIVLIFGAFFFIGYDIPFEDDPEFNAPMLTDLVLIFIYTLITASVILAVAAVVISMKRGGKSQTVVNNIPAAKIAWGTAILLFVCLIITFAAGSSEPVTVNGVRYADTFWLKATDMFINTSIVLLVIAVCVVALGLSGYNRKISIRKP